MEYSNLVVCLMGLGTVFFGLICLVFLCLLMSFIIRKLSPAVPAQKTQPAEAAPAAPTAPAVNRQELIAAISAAIAEESGTDVSAIRIISVKRK